MMTLPRIRSHEIIDFKRCPTKWFWKWKRGLVPRAKTFGALDLGTWMHGALADWYLPGRERRSKLIHCFEVHASTALSYAVAENAPDHVLDKAQDLAALGVVLCESYEQRYGKDPDVFVFDCEIPLEFQLGDTALYRLKPDMVYSDSQGRVWLMEHKTAQTIRTGHLAIDDQARPYGVLAERALKKAGVLTSTESLHGIMYNFIRKAVPDQRKMNEQGHYLNKDGSVSKKQPPPYFLRYPVKLTRAAKQITLRRLLSMAIMITEVTDGLRKKEYIPSDLPITPHYSCERTCDFFAMCVAREGGADVRDMETSMFTVRDPYEYEEDSTDTPMSFEMG